MTTIFYEIMKIEKTLLLLKKKIQNESKIDTKFIIISIFLVSSIRNLMEIFLGRSEYTNPPILSNFILPFTFYCLVFISYTLFISICSGEKPFSIARLLTPFIFVALVIPIFDYLINGYPILYYFSSIADFDPIKISSNNPLGESLILWCIPIISSIYVFLKMKSVKRSIFTFLVIFLLPIIFAIDIAKFFGLNTELYYIYATISSVILLLISFYIQNKEKFGKLFLKFFERMNRIILYLIIFAFGIVTAGNIFYIKFFGIYVFILLIISFIATVVNDYFDYEIDKINRKNNLLRIFKKHELEEIIIISFISILPFLTFIVEGVKNVIFFYYVISLFGLLFLYNYKNLVKGTFPFNYIVDSLSYSIVFMSGRSFFVTTGKLEMAYFLLSILILLFIIPMKDFKDIEGDKKTGVKNLYTLLGKKKAFLICKILLFISFCLFTLCYFYEIFSKNIFYGPIFYLISSVVILPIMTFLFKRKENVELSIWLIDLLLIFYLLPFLINYA